MLVSRSIDSRGFLRGLLSSALLLTTVIGAPALACAIAEGTNADGSPKWTSRQGALTEAAAIQGSRYQEFCGLVTPSDAVAYATTDRPTAETYIDGRFWVFTRDLSLGAGGSVTIHSLLSGGGNSQMDIVIQQGTSGLELVATTPGGNSPAIPIDSTASPYRGWHEVDFTYNQSGTGTGSVVIQLDNDTTETISGLTNSTIEDAWLGIIDTTGATGNMRFDSYEIVRQGDASELVLCDANADGSINPGDVLRANAEVAELLPPPGLASGQADCNGDGDVNPGDVLFINAIVSGLAPNPNL